MLARTLELAIANNKTNISIINKDVQEYELDDQYDHLFSRFGVMFFTDPILSFKNLKKSLKADGSFSFVCWQHPSKNPWHTKPIGILKKYFDLPPAQPRAPSPFAFEEKTYLEEILKSSGFSNYSIDDNLENIHLFPNKSSYDAAKDFMALNPIISNALQGMSDDEKEPMKVISLSPEPEMDGDKPTMDFPKTAVDPDSKEVLTNILKDKLKDYLRNGK